MKTENVKESSLPFVGFMLAMIAFAYLTARLLIAGAPLNFATWALWVVIDLSLTFAMFNASSQKPWIMIGFTIGASVIAIIAAVRASMGIDPITWGKLETWVTAATAFAMVIWLLSNSTFAVVAITVAMYIAMVPTLVDGWNKPVGQDPIFWGICSIGCLLNYIGGEKTVAGRFMPACGTFFNGLMAIFAFRQFFI